MRDAFLFGAVLGLGALSAGAVQAQSGPVYVNPRAPIGHLRLGTGHVEATPPPVPGPPIYVAPDMTVIYGMPDAVQAGMGRTRIYVVVPDVRVRPSEVSFDPPEVHLIDRASPEAGGGGGPGVRGGGGRP